MSKLIAAIHGILTGQTEPSWPDRLDAWIFQRDPLVKVVKKEYRAGPFPRWNCWVKDPLLAAGLANELELFLQPDPQNRSLECRRYVAPTVWMVAHSNGAVIALLAAGLLIERGFRIEGLILTGAACESDIERNGVLEWLGRGMLGAAIAYSSEEDQVLEDESAASLACTTFVSKIRARLWAKLIWPYGRLGRTGWTLEGRPLCKGDSMFSTIRTRWFAGGHSAYFRPQNSAATFEQFYGDMQAAECRAASETRISRHAKSENNSGSFSKL